MEEEEVEKLKNMTEDEIRSLVKKSLESGSESEVTSCLATAAVVAKRGQESLAEEIVSMVDETKKRKTLDAPFAPDLESMMVASRPGARLGSLIQSIDVVRKIKRVLEEQRRKAELEKFGLAPKRKILLFGPSGSGKTLAASILAGELGLKLYEIVGLSSHNGDLLKIFEAARKSRIALLLKPERESLSLLLQLVEHDSSGNVIIVSIDAEDLVDRKLFGSFDETICLRRPKDDQAIRLIKSRLGSFCPGDLPVDSLERASKNLSHGEISRSCDDAIREAVLSGGEEISVEFLEEALRSRKPYQG